MDIVALVNLIFCIVIFGLGIWAYSKKRGDVPLYTGIAFLLFAIAHLLTFLGLAAGLTTLMITVRTIAYLLVIVALCRIVTKRRKL